MSPTEIGGLPAHVLLVHVIVVAVPLTAVLLVLTAVWPRARRRGSGLTAIVALVTLVAVPVTTHAGEWLQRRVPATALVRAHTQLGDGLLPWTVALFVVAAVLWVLQRFEIRRVGGLAGDGGPGTARAPTRLVAAVGRSGTAVAVVLAVLATAVSVGAVVDVYRIGESGARAAWTGHFSQQPLVLHDRRPAG